MELTTLIKHPERFDKETLYDLRSLLALHPYYQPARLLLLKNLYLLHDASFDEELRRAAIYLTDRSKLFELVEAGHYQLAPATKEKAAVSEKRQEQPAADRTAALIDNFLDSIPKDEDEQPVARRKPTPADAAVDYVAYLLDIEDELNQEPSAEPAPEMKGQDLIDHFIENEGGKIQLKDEIDFTPEVQMLTDGDENDDDDGYFTETLAKIYIKQGRYSKALEIIQRLNLNYPKKNAYFADQIRFLEKLILNNKQNNKQK